MRLLLEPTLLVKFREIGPPIKERTFGDHHQHSPSDPTHALHFPSVRVQRQSPSPSTLVAGHAREPCSSSSRCRAWTWKAKWQQRQQRPVRHLNAEPGTGGGVLPPSKCTWGTPQNETVRSSLDQSDHSSLPLNGPQEKEERRRKKKRYIMLVLSSTINAITR